MIATICDTHTSIPPSVSWLIGSKGGGMRKPEENWLFVIIPIYLVM